MNHRRGFKDVISELGVPGWLLKIIGITAVIPLFGFHAVAENLWMDNWFWVPVTYFCVSAAWTSILVMLVLMVIKENRDLRKTRE